MIGGTKPPRLPSLILLSDQIAAKRGRDDDADSYPGPTKPKAELVGIDTVNWTKVFQKANASKKVDINTKRVFRVVAPDTTITLPSGEKVVPAQTYQIGANFDDEDDEEDVSDLGLALKITTDDNKVTCTLVEIKLGSNELHLSSLFFGLTDDQASTCSVSPRLTYYPGTGDMVLATLRHIAYKTGFHITLTDASRGRVRDNTPLFLKQRYLTPALAINRGFGYYEARGFLPLNLYETTDIAYSRTPEAIPGAMLLLKEVLLQWTFYLSTTPISNLGIIIQSFEFKVDRVVDSFTTRFNFDYSNHPVKDFFNRDRLKSHPSGEEFRDLMLNVDYYLREFPKEKDQKPANFISLRDLSRVVALDEQMKKDRSNAIQKEDLYIVELYNSIMSTDNFRPPGYDRQQDIRSIVEILDYLIEKLWSKIGDECFFCIYDEYACPTYTVDGKAVFVGVENSQIRMIPPTAVFKPLDENFLVELKEENVVQ